MTKLPRMLLGLATLLLGTMFFLPIWYIGLQAPQYPEGISLYIKLSSIVGGGEFDLSKVNMLNHYIGMKAIDAASIPELRYMPWIVGLLMLSGFAAAWAGKYKGLLAWTGAFALAAIAGLVDFYRWGYDYGHNLAPDAVIKIPGMSYQPPIIGTKQLLNFTAHSWPAAGGVAAGIALLLAVLAIVIAWRGRRHSIVALAAVGVLATACVSNTARPELSFDGREACAVCRMSLTDLRVGGVVLTSKGMKYTFDSVDCLASFAATNDVSSARIWVLDFEHPGTLLPVVDAAFVPTPAGLSTGMAGTLIAISSHQSQNGESQDWKQVVAATTARNAEPRP